MMRRIYAPRTKYHMPLLVARAERRLQKRDVLALLIDTK